MGVYLKILCPYVIYIRTKETTNRNIEKENS